MTYGLTAFEFVLDLGPRPAAARPREPRGRAVLQSLLQRLRDRFATASYEPVEPDLIDHPAFRGMSQRELADLPFPRHSMTDAAGAESPAPHAPST